MCTDAILLQAFGHVLNNLNNTSVDPVKNVYGNGVISFDHENAFSFLDRYYNTLGTVNVVNIQNAASLYTIMILADEIGIIRVADAVLKYATIGKIDIESSTTSTRLYNYMQLRDDRPSFEERSMWYKQVFDIGGGSTLPQTVNNSNFLPLWESLMTEVIKYIDKYEGADDPDRISKSGINQVIVSLQHNLSSAASGLVKSFIPSMYAHLEDAIHIISAEELKNQLGHGVSRDLWNVVENVSEEEFGYIPNTSALVTIADTARNILLDIAKYNQATFNEEEFQNFVTNVEAFIIAQNQLNGSVSNDSDGYDDNYYEDDSPYANDVKELETAEENWDF